MGYDSGQGEAGRNPRIDWRQRSVVDCGDEVIHKELVAAFMAIGCPEEFFRKP
jgi:hypothetical protein